MRFDNLRSTRQPRLMIIPMIDVILFLLVFFMLSTLCMIDQKTIPVGLPQSAAAKNDSTENIPVTMTANHQIHIFQQIVPSGELASTISVEVAKHPGSGVILRADKTLEYGRVAEVLGMLQSAGIQHVSVAVEQPEAK
ncbi:MAG: biopolymer transporter ExbD [Negativicutes bacterium]|jgi:biopolymer transport protein ExbD